MASESGWGTINGRTARRLEDGWIVVKDTDLIGECDVGSYRRAPLVEGTHFVDSRYDVESLMAEFPDYYINWDGFGIWRDHPGGPGFNGIFNNIGCGG